MPTKFGLQLLIKILLSLVFINSFFELTNAAKNPVFFLILVGLLYLSIGESLKQWEDMEKKNKIILLSFSLLTTITTFLGGKVVLNGSFYSGSYLENYFSKITIWDCIWAVCFIGLSVLVLLFILRSYDRISDILRKKNKKIFLDNKRLFLLSWIFIFVCWLPYLIIYYPGALYGDSQVSIGQALGQAPLTNHHPVMYTLLIKLFITLGKAVKDVSFGCCLYTLFQMLLLSGIFSCFLCWLRRKKCPDILILFFGMFYAFTPIIALHAISMWKDPIFSAFLLLLTMLTYDIVSSKGEMLKKVSTNIQLVIYSLIICFIRNNGIYILLVYWIVLAFYYGISKKNRLNKKGFLAVFFGCAAFYFLITGPVYSKLNITSEFVESLSIPLQQMASVAAYDGKMTAKQEAYLYKLLPQEDIKAAYTPCCVDNFKWNQNFNNKFLENNKMEFFETWAGMLLPNLKLYIKAYIMETFEYWSFSDVKRNTYTDPINTLTYTALTPAKDYSKAWFGHSWKKHFPFSYVFLSEGLVTWIMLFCILQLWLKNRGKMILSLLPLLTAWATLLVSVPHAAWQRYTLSSTYALPFFIMLGYMAMRDRQTVLHRKPKRESEV